MIMLFSGSLRSEKVELSALVKRQQVRIQHLESTGNILSKQVNM